MLKLYQLPVETEYYLYSYGEAQNMGFNINDYICVYSTDKNDTKDLEKIFDAFNLFDVDWVKDAENNHNIRYMAVSDIVEVDGKKYYCDSHGWVSLN